MQFFTLVFEVVYFFRKVGIDGLELLAFISITVYLIFQFVHCPFGLFSALSFQRDLFLQSFVVVVDLDFHNAY